MTSLLEYYDCAQPLHVTSEPAGQTVSGHSGERMEGVSSGYEPRVSCFKKKYT